MKEEKPNTSFSDTLLFKWSRTFIGKCCLHTLFWLIFLLYLIADGVASGVDLSCMKCVLIDNAGYLLSTMLGVYLNAYVIVPKLLYSRRIVSYILCFIVLVGITSSIKVYVFNNILEGGDVKELGYYNTFFVWFCKDFFEIFAISSIKIAFDWIVTTHKLKTKESQELEAEYKFLKAQVNPHFIFNTLNNIFFLTSKNSAKAGEAILSLSNILRYRIYDRKEEDNTIENEIECIRELIALEKLRNSDNIEIELIIEGGYNIKKVEPLLFIPFIENAFKHSKSLTNQKYIKIFFYLLEHEIQFKCENSFVKNTLQKENYSSGIGLKNVINRLKLIYPDNHKLSVTETDTVYISELIIKV